MCCTRSSRWSEALMETEVAELVDVAQEAAGSSPVGPVILDCTAETPGYKKKPLVGPP